VLSRTLEQGEIGWFNANPAEGKGRLMQIDPASQTVAANTRLARNFSCSYTYVLCGASISPDSITLNDGASSSPLEVIPAVCLSVSPFNCSGQSSSYGGMGYTYEWSVDGPAEVNGSYTESTATLQGTGTGTGCVYCMIVSNYDNSNCQENPFGTLNVTPVIQSVSPAAFAVGDTISVTINGSGFGSSPSVSAGTIQVTVSSSTNTQIVATLVIPDDQGGTQGLTVTANGQTSAAYSIFKQVFTHFLRVTVAGAPSGAQAIQTPCYGSVTLLDGAVYKGYTSVCGVYANFAYGFFDQRSPAQPITHGLVTFSEQFSNVVTTGQIAAPTPITNAPPS